MNVEICANAKINMFLHIVGREQSGYHRISSLMVFLVSIYDLIKILHNQPLGVRFLNCALGEDNTVSKALSLLKEHCSTFDNNVEILIEKNIPIASGMAGGSSNAAKILDYFAKQHALSCDLVCKIATEVGLDTVVCLYNRASMVGGLGEIVVPVLLPRDIFVVIINNGKQLLSSDLYALYRNNVVEKFSNVVNIEQFSNDNFLEIIANFKNDLQPFAIKILPEIEEMLYVIAQQRGCIFSRMSGSGPTCFGVFYCRSDAELAEKRLQIKYENYYVKFSAVF